MVVGLTREGDVVVGEGEPRHDQCRGAVDRLNVEEQDSRDAVTATVQSREMDERIDLCGEGSVQPSSSLANEFGGGLWDVRLAFRQFDESEYPSLLNLVVSTPRQT